MRKRARMLTIAISALCITVMSISGTVLADDSQETGKGPCEGRGHSGHLSLISQVLGLSSDEIKAQMEDGKSIIEIAADQGFSQEELQAALYALMAEKLQEKVADGSLT